MINDIKKSILLIGGGGHCRSILDSLCTIGGYDRIGIIARDKENYKELIEDRIISKYLVGVDRELPEFFEAGWNEAFISLGSIGNPIGRKKIYSFIKEIGFHIPTIIDKTAIISRNSILGEGVFAGKNVVINSGCTVGNCTIVNTGAIIEHDCSIAEFVHISPGSVICGQATIGKDSHIGAGSVVRQGIIVGNNVLIGAGSVVVKNIPDNVKAYGNPCKVVD